MRTIVAALIAVVSLFSQPARTEDASKVLGVWKVTSYKIHFVQENVTREVYGSDPKGYYIFTPQGRLMVILTASGRKPPTNDAEAAALLKTMTSYSARYSADAEKVVFTPDVSWNEVYTGKEQIRFYKIDGNKLTITTPEQQYGNAPDKMAKGIIEFVREQ